jgi:hypothetical protein
MKKRKKKKANLRKRRNTKKLKISQLVINFAQDFISLGNTIEGKQSYLNAACVAWNISLLPDNLRCTAIDHFIEEYKNLNPGTEDINNVRNDIELLIEEKLSMYPNEKSSIVNAQITDNNGKEKIIVFSKEQPEMLT